MGFLGGGDSISSSACAACAAHPSFLHQGYLSGNEKRLEDVHIFATLHGQHPVEYEVKAFQLSCLYLYVFRRSYLRLCQLMLAR